MSIMKDIWILIMILSLILFLTGCCDECDCEDCCGDCCDDDDDDLSDDEDDDGSFREELDTNRIGYVDDQLEDTVVVPNDCDGVSQNRAQVTATRDSFESGYTYTYTFTILACTGSVGYAAVLEGAVPRTVESGIAERGGETTGHQTVESNQEYTQFCLKTGDAAIQDDCVII